MLGVAKKRDDIPLVDGILANISSSFSVKVESPRRAGRRGRDKKALNHLSRGEGYYCMASARPISDAEDMMLEREHSDGLQQRTLTRQKRATTRRMAMVHRLEPPWIAERLNLDIGQVTAGIEKA